MNSTPHPGRIALGACVLLAGFTGCATTTEMTDGPKIVVDGNQYVAVDAPIGSHMKRRVKVSEIREPGMAPSRKEIVTADTDTHILPTTTPEVERPTDR